MNLKNLKSLGKTGAGDFCKQQFIKNHMQGKIEFSCFIRVIYNQYFYGFTVDTFCYILILIFALSFVFIT